MKKILMVLFVMVLFVASATVSFAAVAVKSVEAHQRYPWNGLVDITVTIEGASNDVGNVECVFTAANSATHTSVPVTSITQKGSTIGSDDSWIRQYIWNSAKDIGAITIDNLALTVDVKALGGEQLWEDGPYWAECNVGATKPEEYGYYFWWGDTVGYERNAANDGWASVKDGSEFSFCADNSPTYYKTSWQLRTAGYVDLTGNLAASHDAATVHLGVPWRMPTDAEFSSLISSCEVIRVIRNGVIGYRARGRGAYTSKSIFLPAAGLGSYSNLFSPNSDGYYWSSTLVIDGWEQYPEYAWCIRWWGDGSIYLYNVQYRHQGMSVRPVRGLAK